MRNWTFIFIAVVVAAIAFLIAFRDPTPGLESPEHLTLFSIEGKHVSADAEERFHGYPVLGKVEIADADDRKKLVVALKEGLAQSDRSMAKCFWPRHAIRVVEKGRTIDYVICFECLQLEIREGRSKKTKPITSEPQSVFNNYLISAGIPLSEKKP